MQIWGRGLRVGMMLLGRCFSFFSAREKGIEWDEWGEREKGRRRQGGKRSGSKMRRKYNVIVTGRKM